MKTLTITVLTVCTTLFSSIVAFGQETEVKLCITKPTAQPTIKQLSVEQLVINIKANPDDPSFFEELEKRYSPSMLSMPLGVVSELYEAVPEIRSSLVEHFLHPLSYKYKGPDLDETRQIFNLASEKYPELQEEIFSFLKQKNRLRLIVMYWPEEGTFKQRAQQTMLQGNNDQLVWLMDESNHNGGQELADTAASTLFKQDLEVEYAIGLAKRFPEYRKEIIDRYITATDVCLNGKQAKSIIFAYSEKSGCQSNIIDWLRSGRDEHGKEFERPIVGPVVAVDPAWSALAVDVLREYEKIIPFTRNIEFLWLATNDALGTEVQTAFWNQIDHDSVRFTSHIGGFYDRMISCSRLPGQIRESDWNERSDEEKKTAFWNLNHYDIALLFADSQISIDVKHEVLALSENYRIDDIVDGAAHCGILEVDSEWYGKLKKQKMALRSIFEKTP